MGAQPDLPANHRDRRYRRSVDRPSELDLAKRWPDVLAVARSHGVWLACVRAGWLVEDLDQEVLIRVIARQDGRSRYDPVRAGLGKYLFVATRGILLNLLEMRRTQKVLAEEIGVAVQRDTAMVIVDAAQVAESLEYRTEADENEGENDTENVSLCENFSRGGVHSLVKFRARPVALTNGVFQRKVQK